MLRLLWWEFLGWTLIAVSLGYALADFVWTVLVSDAAAARHFARSNWKSWLTVAGGITLAVVALVGWLY